MLKYPHDNYHAAVMNIRAANPYAGVPGKNDAYLQGHRDARHAAAELANSADAEIERLRVVLQRIALNISGDTSSQVLAGEALRPNV